MTREGGRWFVSIQTREGGRWFVSIQTRTPGCLSAAGLVPTLGIDLACGSVCRHERGRVDRATEGAQKAAAVAAPPPACPGPQGQGLVQPQESGQAPGRCIARQGWLYKLATRLANEHPVITIEDLRIMCMTASARGTVASAEASHREVKGGEDANA